MEVVLVEFRIPSLQHFVTFCGGSVDDIYKRILRSELDDNPISYKKLRTEWLFDLLRLRVPYEQVYRACQKLKGQKNRDANLSALAALKPYVDQERSGNCVTFEKTYYPIGRRLHVPVNPPLLIVGESERKVVWVSFWSTDKLKSFTASLFATILEEAIFTLPDLRDFELELVDLSRPEPGKPRAMRIRDRRHFPLLQRVELKAETDKFVEALLRRLKERKAAKPAAKQRPDLGTDGLPLFLDRGV